MKSKVQVSSSKWFVVCGLWFMVYGLCKKTIKKGYECTNFHELNSLPIANKGILNTFTIYLLLFTEYCYCKLTSPF